MLLHWPGCISAQPVCQGGRGCKRKKSWRTHSPSGICDRCQTRQYLLQEMSQTRVSIEGQRQKTSLVMTNVKKPLVDASHSPLGFILSCWCHVSDSSGRVQHLEKGGMSLCPQSISLRVLAVSTLPIKLSPIPCPIRPRPEVSGPRRPVGRDSFRAAPEEQRSLGVGVHPSPGPLELHSSSPQDLQHR